MFFEIVAAPTLSLFSGELTAAQAALNLPDRSGVSIRWLTAAQAALNTVPIAEELHERLTAAQAALNILTMRSDFFFSLTAAQADYFKLNCYSGVFTNGRLSASAQQPNARLQRSLELEQSFRSAYMLQLGSDEL